MTKKLKIAVFGFGFIGSNTVLRLIEDGHEVSVIDRKICPTNLIGKVNWFQVDILMNLDLPKILYGVDTVFHMFSNTVPGNKIDIKTEIFENVNALVNILDACLKNNINKLFFLSSASVYGSSLNIPITEKERLLPLSMHAVHKITVENILNVYNEIHNMNCKIIRLSNPYGIGQKLNGRQGLISILIGNYLRNEVTSIRGNGSSIRDYIHINDVVNALILLLNSDTSFPIFNLGSGKGVSINHIINLISKSINNDLKIQYVPDRGVDVENSVLDTSLLFSETGFLTTIDLEIGIEEYIRYCLSAHQ